MIDAVKRDEFPRYEIRALERKPSLREEATLEEAIKAARKLAQVKQNYMVIHDRFDPRHAMNLKSGEVMNLTLYGVHVAGYF